MFTLTQALAAIEGKPEFKVIEKEGYVVIDYNLETADTFAGPHADILINLRGTAFDPDTGRIVSLGFHKFRNLGETIEYQAENITWGNVDSVMLKMDGSMIRPIKVGEGWVFGTRAGQTDVSAMVDKWYLNLSATLRAQYDEFIKAELKLNYTPIFEFTSRQNKVVIDYPEPQLTLLAIRCNLTGDYLTYFEMNTELIAYGGSDDIPIVQNFSDKNVGAIISAVKGWRDAEGVVVALKNGFRFKVKADYYVTRHRAKDLIRFNKDVIRLILEGKLDDVLPLVDDDKPTAPRTIGDMTSTREKLVMYRDHVIRSIEREEAWMRIYVEMNSILDKKTFAQNVIEKYKDRSKFMFRLYDGKTTGVHEYLLTSCSSATKINEALKLLRIDPWGEV